MVDFSHVVVGAGAVGLAIGARIARAGKRVLLVEKNPLPGQETSSRNSEVVHAGIYHPPDSLRTKLCIQGKEMIYEAAAKAGVEVHKCGKWVVAQDDAEGSYLERMLQRARYTGVVLNWLSPGVAKRLEPAIKAEKAILESPTSGILSAHSLMDFYEAELQTHGGDLATQCKLVGLSKTAEGYQLECEVSGEPEPTIITAESVINSAGLYAPQISNMLLPPDRHVDAYYAKGSYFAYTLSTPKVGRLIYPCPSNFGSLGTHLTIDLGGRLKFGPDFAWVDSPTDLEPTEARFKEAEKEIRRYINIDTSQLVPDYSGIRPKIKKTTEFLDFVIREEDGFPGFINLLNIESPGLTASMAIGEYVYQMVK